MSKYRTSELKGGLLDAAVVKAEGDMDADMSALPRAVMIHRGSDSRIYSPSTNWFDGGPIVERERISLNVTGDDGPLAWQAGYDLDMHEGAYFGSWAWGSTPLIAAMHAYVASKLGDEVELP